MAAWSERVGPEMPPRGSGGSGIFLRGEALRAFDDAVVLRDPAGRSRRPSLVPASNLRSERGLLARRPFLLHVRYIVARESGRDFCRATGDDNPIHLAGDVVPGAYTASRALLPIEVLFPAVELSEFSVRFSAVARYDRPQHMAIRCSPAASGASFSAVTTQDGTVVAEVEASARWVDPASPAPAVRRREVSVARLRAVRTYLQSLRVAPHAFFRHAAREGYFYPRSYLAALPSGAMVQQLRGEGGLLNKLSLEFAGGRVPITASALPEVSLERPRARRSFNKVLAAIGDGIRTYVRGTALVLSREAAPPAVVAALFGSSEPRPRLVVEPGR